MRSLGRLGAALALATIALAFAVMQPAQAATGAWERAWGKDVDSGGGTGFEICTVAANCKAGVGGVLGGELQGPDSVTTDSVGNVYVTDPGNRRVQKFAASGTWDRAWGEDVDSGDGTGFEICTVAANCKAGGGFDGGSFDSPIGIATDSAGNVYVVDAQRHEVQKFDSLGNFLEAWGKDVIKSGAPGDTGTGFEICTVGANCKPGASGSLGGEMSNPAGIATDSSGNVYVSDDNNDRIQKFDSSGNFQAAWGRDVDSGGGTGYEICTVAANCKAGTVLTGAGGELANPIGIDEQGGKVYVGETSSARVQRFDTSGTWERAWGKNVNGGGVFGVCTVAANCHPGSPGTLGGESNGFYGIAVDGSHVYATDSNQNRIEVFDHDGGFEAAWGDDVDSGGGTGFEICTVAANCKAGVSGGLGGELNSPFGLAADADGTLYVADQNNARIQRFSDSGPPSPQTLSVTVAGPGTVTGNGISCPADCSGSYAQGSVVALTATPGSGATFTGWGGACSGTGACQVTMTADQTVSATFTSAGGGGGSSSLPAGSTGRRAAALKKCRKKKGRARRNCIKRAKKLPL